MQILQPLLEILAQLSLKLEKLETGKYHRSSEKCPSSMSISFKLPKIKFSVFDGNPLEW